MHVAAGEEWQRNCAWPANFANKGRGVVVVVHTRRTTKWFLKGCGNKDETQGLVSSRAS